LEKFTDIKINEWAPIIQKGNFIREFWPSQNLLGEKGVFNGRSAIIQMPTSAGKTKSIEIIIRSSFLGKKVKLAVIVAPFRALCAEIRNNLVEAFSDENINVDAISDAMIPDFEAFDIFEIEPIPTVLVSTPEKLVYMLRHDPTLAEHIGLIIYDEGHQFDSGLRGVVYELMISSLKRLIPREIQVILISAVLSNAKSIGEWLKPGIEVVAGTHLSPTYRTIAFTSWRDYRGRLDFIDAANFKLEYFVPRVLEQISLEKLGREIKKKAFPEKDDGKQVALYLGLKLVQNGSVAIFCGTKSTVQGICELATQLANRNAYKVFPSAYADPAEIQKLTKLSSMHFGEGSIPAMSSQLGIFAHSANTPQGIRLAVEYAMQKSLIKFVVCTSTLAQGVNLPIKYLIVTSIYQAGEKIKTRDFHNLIGRAGRSGIHTEGSIIFADPEVYDNREVYRENYKWKAVQSLLNPMKAEPCLSTLLSIFDPLYSDNQQFIIEANPIGYIDSYIKEKGNIIDVAEQIVKDFVSPQFSSDNLKRQIVQKISIIAAIESYLMAYSNEKSPNIVEEEVVELAKATLAYQSSNPETQDNIIELFKRIANHINSSFKLGRKRRMYGKTLFGVKDIQHIEDWTIQNYGNLMLCVDEDELISALWSIVVSKITNANFRKVTPQSAALSVAKEWMAGSSYQSLFNNFITTKVYIKAGTQKRKPKLETIIEMCDNVFAFEATLVVAAIREVIIYNYNDEQAERLIELINRCQKSLKYGLKSELAVVFYELGFADRIVSQSLADVDTMVQPIKAKVLEALSANKSYLRLLKTYPSYYINIHNEVLSK
jgi:superfamily II DNA/RNA helicase